MDDSAGEPSDTIPHGTIEPEQLHAILQRLASDWYDGAEVRDRIAAGVLTELA